MRLLSVQSSTDRQLGGSGSMRSQAVQLAAIELRKLDCAGGCFVHDGTETDAQ